MPDVASGFFTPVLEDLFAALPPRSLPLLLPAKYATRDALGVRHSAHARILPGLAEIRAVHLAGPRAEILNLFLFPAVAAPVFAMEFVAFGKKPVVAVIDAKGHDPVGEALAASVLRTVRARHPALPRGEDAPAWFEECRSGDDFFVRPTDLAQFSVLAAILHDVWRKLLAALPSAPPASSGGLAAVQSYKDHHRHHSPGRPFLHRTFGAEWTEAFMQDFLFSPPGPEGEDQPSANRT